MLTRGSTNEKHYGEQRIFYINSTRCYYIYYSIIAFYIGLQLAELSAIPKTLLDDAKSISKILTAQKKVLVLLEKKDVSEER